mmetsp:Transcript_6867/g.19276  ORF Transcript_6867/g.19276 Transcript_6867/m.19276 type:complete len:310 (-) Transcript_6867:955-1884(-)
MSLVQDHPRPHHAMQRGPGQVLRRPFISAGLHVAGLALHTLAAFAGARGGASLNGSHSAGRAVAGPDADRCLRTLLALGGGLCLGLGLGLRLRGGRLGFRLGDKLLSHPPRGLLGGRARAGTAGGPRAGKPRRALDGELHQAVDEVALPAAAVEAARAAERSEVRRGHEGELLAVETLAFVAASAPSAAPAAGGSRLQALLHLAPHAPVAVGIHLHARLLHEVLVDVRHGWRRVVLRRRRAVGRDAHIDHGLFRGVLPLLLRPLLLRRPLCLGAAEVALVNLQLVLLEQLPAPLALHARLVHLSAEIGL